MEHGRFMHYHLLQFSAKVLIGLSVKMRERQNTEVPACLPPCKAGAPYPVLPVTLWYPTNVC